jgi:hypothetical protein
MLSILKIEEYNYSLVYTKEGNSYRVYRRINKDAWEILSKEKWKKLEDFSELERIFNLTFSQNN